MFSTNDVNKLDTEDFTKNFHEYERPLEINQVEPSIPIFVLVSDQDHILTTRN